MKWQLVAIAGFSAILVAYNLLLLTEKPPPPPLHPITRAYVIALDPDLNDFRSFQEALHIQELLVLKAIDPPNETSLPLYVRHIFHHGRSDHIQIPNPQAASCLLSHRAIWDRIQRSNKTAFVFEEDIDLSSSSLQKLNQLMEDASNVPWQILLLDPGHINSEGEWNRITRRLANCSSMECINYGSRAYVLKPEGAALLLNNFEWVQADSLIHLVSSFHGLRAYWTTGEIFPYIWIRKSTIFDGCIKCYVPTGLGIVYLVLIAILVITCTLKKIKK